MASQTNRFRVDQDGLFTSVEHAILAEWFGQRRSAVGRIKLDDALAQLGFGERCEPYSQMDAVVAHIVLEAIEDRLPVWVHWTGDDLIKARKYREPHERPRRQAVLLLPSELFAINWASSGPGFDWPVHYHLVWIPIYERFVVTASADCSDSFGYADFALGHFGRNDNVGQSVLEIIKRDWTMQRDQCSQERWEMLIHTGLIKEAAVELTADQVWPRNDGDEGADEEDALHC
jgi:hypothetical protein